MTITIKKLHLALIVFGVALVVPATAYALHIFEDVPDDAFYAEPVEWAASNGITTGKSPAIFDPLTAVTRGESVTFDYRYDQNIVQPALDAVNDEFDAMVGLFASDTDHTVTDIIAGTTPIDLGLSAPVTIPAGHTGVIEIDFTAESVCWATSGTCTVRLLVDGTPLGDDDFAFDSTDDGNATLSSWEGHAMTRATQTLAAGTYEVTATRHSSNIAVAFGIDDMVLTAQVHLMS